MAVLHVLHYPDERLRTVAKPVEAVTPEIQQLVDDMLDTMYDENGIGLAATQVNVHLRVVVIDLSEDSNEPMVFINPEIIARSGDTAVTVFLTDGRANIDRHGAPGRTQATQDATAAARAFAVTGLNALLIDTSPQPADAARELAAAMGASYIPLPYAGAAGLTQAVLLAQSTG